VNLYRPAVSVEIVRVLRVATFMTSTIAPGITHFRSSRTTPESAAVGVCALIATIANNKEMKNE
jgi:hypothetical protein